MKRLGLLGGVTWHSTAAYYRGVNEGVAEVLGPFRSSDLALRSLDYGAVREAREGGNWRPLKRLVVEGCRSLRQAGAEGLVLCSNSLHAVADAVESEVGLPVLHIADALADEAKRQGHSTLAFFGTGFTMQARFYRQRLEDHGLTVRVPDDPALIDAIIMDELARGVVRDASREMFLQALQPLVEDGATAMVLGCTEIGMLVKEAPVPLLDTLDLHVRRAVVWQLGNKRR